MLWQLYCRAVGAVRQQPSRHPQGIATTAGALAAAASPVAKPLGHAMKRSDVFGGPVALTADGMTPQQGKPQVGAGQQSLYWHSTWNTALLSLHEVLHHQQWVLLTSLQQLSGNYNHVFPPTLGLGREPPAVALFAGSRTAALRSGLIRSCLACCNDTLLFYCRCCACGGACARRSGCRWRRCARRRTSPPGRRAPPCAAACAGSQPVCNPRCPASKAAVISLGGMRLLLFTLQLRSQCSASSADGLLVHFTRCTC